MLADHAARLVANERHGRLAWLSFDAPKLARRIRPGQFVNVAVPGHLLRRPLASAGVDGNRLDLFVYALREGSAAIVAAVPGTTWSLLGPLGLPWSPPEAPSAVLVGGGTGTAPLVHLAQELLAAGATVQARHGAPGDAEIWVLDRYPAGVERIYYSEDGSAGRAGFPTAGLADDLRAMGGATVYACGPYELMRAAALAAREAGASCQVSVEAYMGCGVGACLSCVVRTTTGQIHACVDGPCVDAELVPW